MVKKTDKTKKKATFKQMLKDAKSRLPSERTKLRCDGCFNPRDTLTVKGNLEHVWTKQEIKISEDKSGVYLPCSICKTVRYLNLSKFSLDVFKSDYEKYLGFVLLKDDKYNALVGLDVSEGTVDLGEWKNES